MTDTDAAGVLAGGGGGGAAIVDVLDVLDGISGDLLVGSGASAMGNCAGPFGATGRPACETNDEDGPFPSDHVIVRAAAIGTGSRGST